MRRSGTFDSTRLPADDQGCRFCQIGRSLSKDPSSEGFEEHLEAHILSNLDQIDANTRE